MAARRRGIANADRRRWPSSMQTMPMSEAVRSRRKFLETLFNSAIAAAHPASSLPSWLPAPPPEGRLIILAAGKAAGSMTEIAEQHYLDIHRVARDRLAGVAVARHGYGRPTRLPPAIAAPPPPPPTPARRG